MNCESSKQMIKEYEHIDLYSIGEHIVEKSTYNYNFYSLPNGEVVLMVNDDEGWNDVFVVGDKGETILVGGQYDDEGLMIGTFT